MNTFPTPKELLSVPYLPSTFSTSTPATIPWDSLAAMIKTDLQLKAKVEHIRAIRASGTEKEYAKAKATVGAYIPAAQFSGGRKREHITALTGVAMVDFDHVPADKMAAALDAVRRDPHTFLAYVTTSGEGIRVLYRYTSRQAQIAYIDAWRWGNQYYAMVTGLQPDEATKDPTRLSFLCHDAQCHYNPGAVVFEVVTNEEALAEIKQVDAPAGQQAAALAQRIADRKIPFAEGSRHRNLLYRAYLLNKMGMGEQQIAEALRPAAPRGDDEAQSLAAYVAANGKADFGAWQTEKPKSHKKKRLPLAQGGQPAQAKVPNATPEEIRKFLMKSGMVRRNVISARLEVLDKRTGSYEPIDDSTQNELWHECNVAVGKYVKMPDFNAELYSAVIERHNPFEAYFGQLPQWDGTDHIGELATHVTVRRERLALEEDEEVFGFGYCFRKWFVSMVASWLEPSVMNDTILTFVGEQGIYKSTFFRRLLPPELGKYFLVKGNSSYLSKDDKLAVANYGLIDFEELDSMRPSDLNAVKALVTTELIDERAAYARNRKQLHHVASFCATGNNRQFLTDVSGNRRWLPFEVLSIASPYDNPIPYEQLYAQALHLIRSGWRYWFNKAEHDKLERHKDLFSTSFIEAELIGKYYRRPERGEAGLFYTATDILTNILPYARQHIRPERIGIALTKLGVQSKFVRGKKGYVLVERNFDEISNEKHELATESNRQDKGKQIELRIEN